MCIRDSIHPGPAALVGTGEGVEVELAPQVAIPRADLEEAHIRMPGLDPLDLADADVEEPLQQVEEAVEDPADREIGPQLLLGNGVAMLAQLFRIVGQVPGLKRAGAPQGPGKAACPSAGRGHAARR